MEDMEWDSDSDGPDFYEPAGREVEEFLNNIEDTASMRSTALSVPTSLFTSKEDEEIVNINNVLLLNKQTEAKYKRLEEVLYKTLLEIRQKIKENSQAIISHTNTATNAEFSYLRSGRPYFKDKNNYQVPDNQDTIIMKQAHMYDFHNVSTVPGWTVRDKTQLVNTLQEISRNIRKKELNSQIVKLGKENKPENVEEIAKLEKQMASLNKKTLMEIALPLDEEYDWESIANKLNRRHTAQEYQSLWKLFFHPSINKSNWSKSEHQKLQMIAMEMNMQNWDLIAKKLDTGRTGYQCFVYFRTNMIDSLSSRKWTDEEVEYLQRVIEYFREGSYIPWGKVATAMDNRTKIQVYNKYTRMMERRKGRFLEEEDIVILNCFDRFGVNFKKMAQYLPGRSSVQLRTRFNILTRFRVSTTWTVADDKKLVQIMANQDANFSFSTATQHFPGKDRMHIRSRYMTLMKWMKTHPATDIALAPRRGARRLVHGYASMSLNEALANLNNRMENEVKNRKSRRLTRTSHEKDIEDGIMASLINEIMREESRKKPQPANVEDLDEILDLPASRTHSVNINITNLKKILLFLNAFLDIDQYKRSRYSRKFKGLEEVPTKVPKVKVKSYSKTQKIKTIEMNNTPDIWGNLKLGPMKYVLPPNFSSITGCRVLLNNIKAKSEVDPDDDVNLSLMARRNEFFKEALNKLRDRFATLFLWPLLLSNESPSTSEKQETYTPPIIKKHKLLPDPTGVTIPPPKKTMILKKKTEDIDLLAINPIEANVNINSSLLDNAAILDNFHVDSIIE